MPCYLFSRVDVPTPTEFIVQCDREHEVIRRLYDDMVIADFGIYRDASLKKILKVLTLYVKFHFSREHDFMFATEYYDIEYHSIVHNRFVLDLNEIKQDYENGLDVHERIKILHHTKTSSHIMNTDLRLLEFARSMSKSCRYNPCGRCAAPID